MKYKLIIDFDDDGIRRYVIHNEHPQAVLLLHDKTNVPEPELNLFKQKVVNYASTEPAGRYFLLTIEAVKPHDYESENMLAKTMGDILLGAADYVHKMFSEFSSN